MSGRTFGIIIFILGIVATAAAWMLNYKENFLGKQAGYVGSALLGLGIIVIVVPGAKPEDVELVDRRKHRDIIRRIWAAASMFQQALWLLGLIIGFTFGVIFYGF